jgi:hypothetical protein
VRLVMQKEAEQKAQRRSSVQAAGRVERSARLAFLQAGPGGAADAYVQWKDALYALQEAGGLTTARTQGGVGPVDLLWEVAGEQSTKYTKYFHRLGRQHPAAPAGMTSVRVSTAAGVPRVHSVHDAGGCCMLWAKP